VDTRQESTTAKDPSSEGMLLHTRGVCLIEKKKDAQIQKTMKKPLGTGRPR
jgi:hypothetical protein